MNIFCPDPCVTCDPIPLGAEGIFPNPNSEANPFINFSSEAPDVDLFIKFRYGPTGPTIGIPPLGNPWTASGCIGICFSPISQADADRCAYNQSVLCTPGIWPGNPDAAACLLDPDACRPIPPPTFFNTVQSCTAFCPDGSPFTFFVQGGQYAALSQASANAIAFSQACNQAELRKICLSALPGGCVGEGYDAVISGSSSEPSLVFSLVAGSLPSGTVLSQGGPKVVTIAGTPDAVGLYVFTIQATAPSGAFTTKQYSVRVVSIVTSSPLLDGQVGQPYSYTLMASGTTGTVHWFISGGQLPAGLSLNELTGEISGTPTGEETQTFFVEMRDDTSDCLKQFVITSESGCPPAQEVITNQTVVYPPIPDCPEFPPPPDTVLSESHTFSYDLIVDLYDSFPILLMWDGNCPPQAGGDREYEGGSLTLGPYAVDMQIFAGSSLICDDFFTITLDSILNPPVFQGPANSAVPYGTCMCVIPAGSVAIVRAFESGGVWCFAAGKMGLLNSACFESGGGGCADFNGTVWSAPEILQSGDGVTVANFTGADIAVSATVGPWAGPDNVADVSCTGTVTIQGQTLNCCLEVISEADSGGGGAGINIFQGATLLLGLNNPSVGQHTFSIPGTCLPTALTIVVTASASSSSETPAAKSGGFTAHLGACP